MTNHMSCLVGTAADIAATLRLMGLTPPVQPNTADASTAAQHYDMVGTDENDFQEHDFPDMCNAGGLIDEEKDSESPSDMIAEGNINTHYDMAGPEKDSGPIDDVIAEESMDAQAFDVAGAEKDAEPLTEIAEANDDAERYDMTGADASVPQAFRVVDDNLCVDAQPQTSVQNPPTTHALFVAELSQPFDGVVEGSSVGHWEEEMKLSAIPGWPLPFTSNGEEMPDRLGPIAAKHETKRYDEDKYVVQSNGDDQHHLHSASKTACCQCKELCPRSSFIAPHYKRSSGVCSWCTGYWYHTVVPYEVIMTQWQILIGKTSRAN